MGSWRWPRIKGCRRPTSISVSRCWPAPSASAQAPAKRSSSSAGSPAGSRTPSRSTRIAASCECARCTSARARLFHDSHEEKHELQHQDEHDRQLEELAAIHRGLIDGEAIDVVERLELVTNRVLP